MGRKLRLGVIGLGMGRGHIKGYQAHPEAEVVAVCDQDTVRLADAQKEFGIAALYTDYKEMLRKEKLDGVSVAVPNVFHAPMTIAALKAGAHVLCEKPMAMSVREAEAMAAEARKAKRNIMINFSHRFNPTMFALRAQVDAGVIGDIYYGRTVWHRRRGLPGFGGWFGTKAMSGGGPLIDLGVHRLDMALWLMDYPEPIVVSGSAYNVIAAEKAKREKKTYDVEDVACGLIKFANGATLILEASWALNIKEGEHMITQLCGTRGGIVQKNTDQGYNMTAEVYTEEGGALFTKTLDGTSIQTPSSYHEFVDSILEKRQPGATADHGIKVMKILEGVYKSAQTGREVRYRSPR